MGRPILALLAAGLMVPLLVTAYFSSWRLGNYGNYVLVAFFSTIISSSGVLLLGVPAYLLLRARKWTAFWIAPVAGFIVAAVAWYVFLSLLGLSSVRSLSDFLSGLTDLRAFEMVFWPIGPIGVVAGVLVWFIARPDRSAAGGSAENTDKYPKY
ncbi:MAG TPA: hypothetical protein VI232_02430 [Reyranella sp.]|jgi:hypothetical protein|nr:hypothetical protein [Rhodospirillaceae bacterium]MEA2807787.1 hypothetical protein [Rhodospirillaceae bacterium]MEA2846608.1 hypothetical protein [Rhodospirillaceae bacterium]